MYQSFRAIQHVRPNRWHLLLELHCVTSQTRVIRTETSLKSLQYSRWFPHTDISVLPLLLSATSQRHQPTQLNKTAQILKSQRLQQKSGENRPYTLRLKTPCLRNLTQLKIVLCETEDITANVSPEKPFLYESKWWCFLYKAITYAGRKLARRGSSGHFHPTCGTNLTFWRAERFK